MKFISFILSFLLHVLFVLVFLVIIKPLRVPVKHNHVYIVNIVKIQEHKAKHINVRKTKPKIKQKVKLKPKHKHNERPKIERVVKPEHKSKPQGKPKPKIKPNIEKRVQLLKEEIKISQIRERLLRGKIKQLKEHVLNQKRAQKIYLERLTSSYVSMIESLIYSNWGVEKSVINGKIFITKVDLKLDYLGNLVKLSIVKSSGNAYFDGTVIDAIKSSQPFPKPPKDILSGGIVEFIITFDSRER